MRSADAPLHSWLYPETAFGGYSQRDGTVAFYTRVNALIEPTMRVLDYGCGTGAHHRAEDSFTASLQLLRGKVREVIGADIDRGAAANPTIDSFAPLNGPGLPLADGTVDLCLCDWGLEHFDDPVTFFAEANRVLKPAGLLCARTPNAWHYSSIGARIIPFRYHHAVRRLLGEFHTHADVFPTYYRCNTRRSLKHALRMAGFDAVILRHCGESHLRNAGALAARVGEAIERATPRLFWHELHVFARKVAS